MGFGCNCDKAGPIGTAAEGNFAYWSLKALLEEESVVRARGCREDHRIDPIWLG